MHTLQPSPVTDRTLRATTTIPSPAPASSAVPTLETDTEHYESAKGCLMLSLLILGSGVVCTLAGIGISMYIEYSVG